MNRYHLMHQKSGDVYYICDTNNHGYCEAGDGKVHILNTDDMESADNMRELLHKLQDRKELKWFGTLGYLTETGHTRQMDYPHFCEKHCLIGWVPDVCDFRTRKPYLAKTNGKWSVEFISDLWVLHDEYTLKRVACFSEIMMEEAKQFANDTFSNIKNICEKENHRIRRGV